MTLQSLFRCTLVLTILGAGCDEETGSDAGSDAGTDASHDTAANDGALSWYATCGDPVCGAGGDGGVVDCSDRTGMCTEEGETCGPIDGCNTYMICAASDPQEQPGGCPISRAEHKTDIEYLSDGEREALSAELLGIRLATYRYRNATTDRRNLGFIMEDIEPSPAADSTRGIVDLYGYTSMAVAALQEQSREISELRAEIGRLRRMIKRLGE